MCVTDSPGCTPGTNTTIVNQLYSNRDLTKKILPVEITSISTSGYFLSFRLLPMHSICSLSLKIYLFLFFSHNTVKSYLFILPIPRSCKIYFLSKRIQLISFYFLKVSSNWTILHVTQEIIFCYQRIVFGRVYALHVSVTGQFSSKFFRFLATLQMLH